MCFVSTRTFSFLPTSVHHAPITSAPSATSCAASCSTTTPAAACFSHFSRSANRDASRPASNRRSIFPAVVHFRQTYHSVHSAASYGIILAALLRILGPAHRRCKVRVLLNPGTRIQFFLSSVPSSSRPSSVQREYCWNRSRSHEWLLQFWIVTKLLNKTVRNARHPTGNGGHCRRA